MHSLRFTPSPCPSRPPRPTDGLRPTAPPAPERPARTRSVRLVGLLVVMLTAAGYGMAGAEWAPDERPPPVGAPGASPGPGAAVHVVAPGDSLWSIIRGRYPTADIRPMVARLSARRGYRPLQVGERVAVP